MRDERPSFRQSRREIGKAPGQGITTVKGHAMPFSGLPAVGQRSPYVHHHVMDRVGRRIKVGRPFRQGGKIHTSTRPHRRKAPQPRDADTKATHRQAITADGDTPNRSP